VLADYVDDTQYCSSDLIQLDASCQMDFLPEIGVQFSFGFCKSSTVTDNSVLHSS